MRTTLNLDDDVAEAVVRQARARGASIGKTVSELVRRGLNAPTRSARKAGVVVFDLPTDSPKVASADVRRLESDGA
ncbi:MAG: ribbon-helix-helix domain-containing protein [Cyanobacteria bacterium]|nr:ribbon-helix-helix domain-containing protein [Cyanobacteriota bacterium]